MDDEPKALEVLRSEGQPSFGFTKSAASIEVEAGGKKFVEYGYWAKGDPWHPDYAMSYEEVERKFRIYASSVAPLSRIWGDGIEQLASMIRSLEEVQDIREVTRLLSPD